MAWEEEEVDKMHLAMEEVVDRRHRALEEEVVGKMYQAWEVVVVDHKLLA